MTRARGRWTVLIFVALAWLAVPAQAVAAPVLSILPTVTTVTVGNSVWLDVLIADADDLFAYDVEVTFDNTVIEAVLLEDGTFLNENGATATAGFLDTIDNASGFVSGSDSRLLADGGVSGDGLLYRIRFTAVAVGQSIVDFDVACDPQTDPFCTTLFDTTFTELAYSTASAVVDVVAPQVPEPALFALLAVGAAVRGLSRRRR